MLVIDAISEIKKYDKIIANFDTKKNGALQCIEGARGERSFVLNDPCSIIEEFILSLMEEYRIDREVDRSVIEPGDGYDNFDIKISFFVENQPLLFSIVFGDGRFFKIYQ